MRWLPFRSAKRTPEDEAGVSSTQASKGVVRGVSFLTAGTLLVGAAGVVVGGVYLGREAGDVTSMGVIRHGESVYYSECASCHGDNGDRIPAAPLGSREFLDSRGDATLIAVMSEGKGTMPAFSKDRGGPLEKQDIRSLLAYLNHEAGRESTAIMADVGRQIYERECASCHGSNGGRIPIAPLNAKGFLDMKTDADLRGVINRGKGPMPAFSRSRDGTLAPDDVDAVIAFLRYRVQEEVAYTARRGRELYERHCLQCHGTGGDRIPNIDLASARYLESRGDGPILSAISRGKGTMPAYGAGSGGTLGVPDIASMLVYLKAWSGLDATAAMLTEQVAGSGKELYARNCISCHGENGEGVPGVRLFDRAFLERETDDVLVQTITRGNAKGMPAWGEQAGGPLSREQIFRVVDFLKSSAPPAPAEEEQAAGQEKPESVVVPVTSAAVERGEGIFMDKCVVCHGETRDQVPTCRIAEAGYLEERGDKTLVESITFGKGPMPSWGTARGGPLSASDVKDVVAFLKSASGLAEVEDTGSGGSEEQSTGGEQAGGSSGEGGSGDGGDTGSSGGGAASGTAFSADLVPQGEEIFTANCVMCHGETRDKVPACKLADGGWLQDHGFDGIIQAVTNGKPPMMPTWGEEQGGSLSPEEIRAVVSYLWDAAGVAGGSSGGSSASADASAGDGEQATARTADGPHVHYLHAADATVSGTTYNTATQGGVAGTLDTATAPLDDKTTEYSMQDNAGIGIFVSDPVPSGKVWDISGSWTFSPYIRTTIDTRLYMRARVYRIAADGTATEVLYSQSNIRSDTTTSYQLIEWSDSVPAGTVLNSGERFGVAFFVLPDSDDEGESAVLGFDEASAPSAVPAALAAGTAEMVQSAAPGSVREAHYRIGKDTPLDAMEWYAGVDSAATDLPRETNFRVRFQLYNEGAAVTWTPRLEWTATAGSGYAAVPTSSGADPFFVVDTTAYANGDPIFTSDFGLGSGTGTAQAGVTYDTENPAGSTLTLEETSYTEIEFSVQANTNVEYDKTYYFRLTDGGTALTSYDSGDAKVIVPSPPPPTPTRAPPAHNFHEPYASDTSACAACHRVHTSPAPQALRKRWPEEEVCFTCHDGTGAPDVYTQFNKTYRMPIASTTGVHSLGEARDRDPAAFSGTNRHVECTDCHNPHSAGAGSHTIGSNYAFGPQQGMWGVSVSNSSAWTAPGFATVDEVTYQYELCFKCHSSWAYGDSPPDSPSGGFPQTDQAKEFNILNPAYHPVEGIGKNPFEQADGTSYASSLLGGFTPNGRMVCTDCHASETDSDPAGPHGSDNPFILRGEWDRTTGQMPGQKVDVGNDTSDHLCFTCHDVDVYANPANDRAPWDDATGFSQPDRNLHAIMVGARNKDNGDAAIVCMDCHVAVPHGWKRDHLIGFTGDGSPYINRPYTGGLTTIDTWQESGEWTFESCATAMDSCK